MRSADAGALSLELIFTSAGSTGGAALLMQKGLKFSSFHVLLDAGRTKGESELVTVLESSQQKGSTEQGYIKFELATQPGRGMSTK